MGDLDKLIAAVEAGSIAPFYGEFQSALGATLRDDGVKAFDGSLDAALRLHNAMMPGWEWHLGPSNAKIYPYNGNPSKSWGGMADTPARAWLLAILRAMQAQSTPDADTAAIRHHERFGPLDEHGNPVDPRRRG